jgi:hypothetical protein
MIAEALETEAPAIPAFRFNRGQMEAQNVCASDATHIMLEGGSSSGKTVLHLRNIVQRAAKAPGSRHLILRFRFNHVKHSVGLETLPWVLQNCFPELGPIEPDKSDWYWTLPNGAEIWLGGLDDKERTEKILGKRYSTIFLNECSQIPWASVLMAQTRLAQRAIRSDTREPLRLRMFYDCNPPTKGHWTYKAFHQKQDPETKITISDPSRWVFFRINPADNEENLAPGAMDILRGLPARTRRRFLDGEYQDDNPFALFSAPVIDRWRVLNGEIPDMTRMVIGVDPSGAKDEASDGDAIGIVAGGIGTDGNAYLLEDCTIKAGPAVWGKVAASAFDRHRADVIACEKNYGGEMARFTIQTARANTPVKMVNATRGKVVRAEPFSSLYEQGKIRHVGYFREMEDELISFSQNGYLGQGSPNRADAWIWVLTELFPGMVRSDAKPENKIMSINVGRFPASR